MLTQGKIDQFYKDVEILGLKYPVAEIQRATEFPKSNVSEWLSKKKVPSENFIDTFYLKFKKEIAKSSTTVPLIKEQDVTIIEGDNTIMVIELKTASGKTIQVKPDSHTDIPLLNAFLEERDRTINDLQTDKIKLQNTIDINLTALMQLLTALSGHDRAFHDTMLRSLARLEGKKEIDLIGEARSSEAAKQIERMTGSSNDENRI